MGSNFPGNLGITGEFSIGQCKIRWERAVGFKKDFLKAQVKRQGNRGGVKNSPGGGGKHARGFEDPPGMFKSARGAPKFY